MTEIKWKKIPVKEVENSYLVSNDGQVKSIKSKKLLKFLSLRGGYRSVYITKINKKIKVHRLVALAFIPNNDSNKKLVNHKDGNKLNNHVDNLEWTTSSENVKHAIDTGLIKITKRSIYQCDLEGNIIKTHETIRGAGKDTGIDSGGISKCCKGSRKTAGGFKWRFVNVNPNEKEIDTTGYVQINDFPNYLINKEGVIYSKPYKKIMKQQKNNDGYLGIQLTHKGNRKSFLVHRLIASHFVKKERGDSDIVHFIDKDKQNIHADNLKWVNNNKGD